MGTQLDRASHGKADSGGTCKAVPKSKCAAEHIPSSSNASLLPSPRRKLTFVKLSDGERLPMLIEDTGIPHWYATMYITTQARNAGKAPNTLLAMLSAVRSLLTWAESRAIVLEDRFANHQFLGQAEVESLRAFSQSHLSSAAPHTSKVAVIPRPIEGARARVHKADARVSAGTHYARLTYMADYLDWLAVRLLDRKAQGVDAETLEHIRSMTRSIRLHRPRKVAPSRVSARKGLSEEAKERLTALIRADSAFNPFEPELRARNELVVLLLLNLGVRRGELLTLKVTDFDFQRNEVVIPRRHGDATDPRRVQPVAKTMDRRIPLSSALSTAVFNYVLMARNKFPSAKRHAFLVVTHQDGPHQGMPLSIKGLAKVFTTIQRADAQLLGRLTPHVLRHTANDNLSELIDAQDVRPPQEEKMRSYLMGWKEGSGTATTYTRRHTEKKAREISLKLQDGWHRNESNDKS